jgi:hypothetical protein
LASTESDFWTLSLTFKEQDLAALFEDDSSWDGFSIEPSTVDSDKLCLEVLKDKGHIGRVDLELDSTNVEIAVKAYKGKTLQRELRYRAALMPSSVMLCYVISLVVHKFIIGDYSTSLAEEERDNRILNGEERL